MQQPIEPIKPESWELVALEQKEVNEYDIIDLTLIGATHLSAEVKTGKFDEQSVILYFSKRLYRTESQMKKLNEQHQKELAIYKENMITYQRRQEEQNSNREQREHELYLRLKEKYEGQK